MVEWLEAAKMKKILLTVLIILLMPFTMACDMGGSGHDSITGAATGEVCEMGNLGFGMMGFNYLWLIILLYFIIGIGYIIYKLNQIENKIRRKR